MFDTVLISQPDSSLRTPQVRSLCGLLRHGQKALYRQDVASPQDPPKACCTLDNPGSCQRAIAKGAGTEQRWENCMREFLRLLSRANPRIGMQEIAWACCASVHRYQSVVTVPHVFFVTCVLP